MKNSKNTNVIYLHGVDVAYATKQEQANRELLQRLATDLEFNLYISRSPFFCAKRSHQLCWPYESKASLIRTWEHVKGHAEKCFGNKRADILVGFSNGGYFLIRLLQSCQLAATTKFLAIGAAGKVVMDQPGRSCGSLSLMIGKNDKLTLNKTRELHAQFKKLYHDVALIEYDGGHELKENALKEWFKTNVKKPFSDK